MITLNEWLSDLKKQCVLLMGLPAAGKSTFINDELKKIIPTLELKVINSDVQLKALQYKNAQTHFKILSRALKDPSFNEQEYNDILDSFVYVDNGGKVKKLNLSFDDFKNMSFNKYWRYSYKTFYATYFDIRTWAINNAYDLFKDKVRNVSTRGGLAFDGTGAYVPYFVKKFQETKKLGYTNTIIFLDTPMDLCVARDKWRGEHEGRTVSEKVIRGYGTRLIDSYRDYKKQAKTPGTAIDRIYHYKWIQKGNSPTEGTWKLIEKVDYELQRKLYDLKKAKQPKQIEKPSLEHLINKSCEYVYNLFGQPTIKEAIQEIYHQQPRWLMNIATIYIHNDLESENAMLLLRNVRGQLFSYYIDENWDVASEREFETHEELLNSGYDAYRFRLFDFNT